MSRMPINYKDIKDMTYLTSDDLVTIEIKAKAMSYVECLAFICVTEDELPPAEKVYSLKAFNRGRADSIGIACEKMFGAMGRNGGGPVALEYLRQMASEFQVNAIPAPGVGAGFSFNVTMPEGDK